MATELKIELKQLNNQDQWIYYVKSNSTMAACSKVMTKNELLSNVGNVELEKMTSLVDSR